MANTGAGEQIAIPQHGPAGSVSDDRSHCRDRFGASAAPKSISDDASVVVLTRQGYETAVEGKNGFVCIVERTWTAPFDHPEFWNPRNRGPICYNPAAARSVLPYTFYRTKLALEGLTKPQMLERVKAAVANKELTPPEPGAMSYMLSKEGHLNDKAGTGFPT